MVLCNFFIYVAISVELGNSRGVFISFSFLVMYDTCKYIKSWVFFLSFFEEMVRILRELQLVGEAENNFLNHYLPLSTYQGRPKAYYKSSTSVGVDIDFWCWYPLGP